MPIATIKDWFQLAVPEPTDKKRAVQIGVHLEEVAEMAATLNDADLAATIDVISEQYKTDTTIRLDTVDRTELLDALCDQIVTAVGVAHMFGMDIAGALSEVNRSNWSKMDEHGQPTFDENGKIKKGVNYTPPNLEGFL